MGSRDSSRTRVAPVFEELVRRDPTGATWLPKLLRLGSRAEDVRIPSDLGTLRTTHPHWWGNNERSLKPPVALLEWLVLNITAGAVAASGDIGMVLDKRRALAAGDPATVAEALAAIRQGVSGRRWHNLEGESRPDAYLETERIVLVVEGKRTERSCTSKTKWMPVRSQLIRHMDAATDISGDRTVLGLLIVEGEAGGSALEPSPYWLNQSAAQYTDHMLRASLPHRSAADRTRIADGVLGVTTWQGVCRTFALPWPPVPDEDHATG